MPVEGDEKYKKYLDYISNAKDAKGGVLIKIFDEDWEPIGARVRKEMVNADLIFDDGLRVYRQYRPREIKPAAPLELTKIKTKNKNVIRRPGVNPITNYG